MKVMRICISLREFEGEHFQAAQRFMGLESFPAAAAARILLMQAVDARTALGLKADHHRNIRTKKAPK